MAKHGIATASLDEETFVIGGFITAKELILKKLKYLILPVLNGAVVLNYLLLQD